MYHEKLVKELKKLGLEVNQSDWNKKNFYCIGKKYKVSWFMQEKNAICVNIMGKNERTQAETDYFPGFFSETYKEVKSYLAEI